MAISNVDDLYNELSGNQNFSGLFNSAEDFASTMQGMSPERKNSLFEQLGLSQQINKEDFDKVFSKKKRKFFIEFRIGWR